MPGTPYRAGAARAIITPRHPCWIAGYEPNRRSEGVHSDLFAACLVLEAEEERIALVALDLIGLHLPTVRRIRERVTGVATDRILIACTHVHSGPDTLGLWGPEPSVSGVDTDYLNELVETVARLIEEAAQRLEPAELRFASGPIEGVARNDRIPGLLDTEASLLSIRRPGGEPVATVVNFACHPEAMHCRLVSADFPSALYRRAEAEGLGIPLYFNGALGGMVTTDTPTSGPRSPETQIEETEAVGERFADGVIALARAAGNSPADCSGTLRFQTQNLRLPVHNENYRKLERSGLVPPRFVDGDVETELHHLWIGPSEWVTFPGEPTPDIGFYLRRQLTGSPRFIVSLCDDELGYLLCAEHWGMPLFSYETSTCVGPEAGRQMEAALLEMAGQKTTESERDSAE